MIFMSRFMILVCCDVQNILSNVFNRLVIFISLALRST